MKKRHTPEHSFFLLPAGQPLELFAILVSE